jgi:hypothetical protein
MLGSLINDRRADVDAAAIANFTAYRAGAP